MALSTPANRSEFGFFLIATFTQLSVSLVFKGIPDRSSQCGEM